MPGYTDSVTDSRTLSLDAAEALASAALEAVGTAPGNAVCTARALVAAEADGQVGHGLSRVPSYAGQVSTGKVNGAAQPTLEPATPATIRIDAGHGFAYPAIELALEELPGRARTSGIALAAIYRSHHFGQAGAHVEKLAERGLLALAFGNSPRGIAFWGGKRAMLGTNPIAFAAPTGNAEPLLIDLAMSQAARAKVVAARKAGADLIPEGWALNAEGQPTTDPAAALQGSMLPIGGAKGAALALMVEVLSAALTGSHFGWEASSLFDGEGDAPNLGQILIAIDPGPASRNQFARRMQTLLEVIAAEDDVRLPGSSRLANRERARERGLDIPAPLYAEIQQIIDNGGH